VISNKKLTLWKRKKRRVNNGTKHYLINCFLFSQWRYLKNNHPNVSHLREYQDHCVYEKGRYMNHVMKTYKAKIQEIFYFSPILEEAFSAAFFSDIIKGISNLGILRGRLATKSTVSSFRYPFLIR